MELERRGGEVRAAVVRHGAVDVSCPGALEWNGLREGVDGVQIGVVGLELVG